MNNINIFAFADEASPMIDEQIAAMKRNRLQGLEIRNVDDVNISDISESHAKEVRKKLDDASLEVWSIGSPIGKIDIESGDLPAHIEKLKHTLEVSNILGAKNLRLFSFYIPHGKNADDYSDEVVDRLGKIAELSVSAGITPCHENEKGIFGDSPERCLELYKELPQLSGIFDPANFVQCGVDTAGAWEMLKTHIKYLHIKDSLPDGTVVPAGEGAGNIADILSDYISRGGDAVTLEPHLTVFKGLAQLERAGEQTIIQSKYSYENPNAAFDAACNALKNLLGV